jgi:hypothetical protein
MGYLLYGDVTTSSFALGQTEVANWYTEGYSSLRSPQT